MNILLINSAEIEQSPYLQRYIAKIIANDKNICTVLEWRRDFELKYTPKEDFIRISYNEKSSIHSNYFSKLINYYRFSKFVRKELLNKYDKVIVFDLQILLFISNDLIGLYKNRYMLDIRDYSPIYPLVKNNLLKLIKYSFSIVISSAGYKEWLPNTDKFVLCHNISNGAKKRESVNLLSTESVKILTIGCLRNFEIDKELVKAFADYPNVFLDYAGTGYSDEQIDQLIIINSNVNYSGPYCKNDELSIAISSDFINLILPDCKLYNTAMANRFYLSLLIGKPLIVNSESIHAKYVEKYNLGIVVNDINDIKDIYYKMNNYILNFNPDLFDRGRNEILKIICKDMDDFNRMINRFITE